MRRPTAWTGVRLPHAWLPDGRSTQDLCGDGFTVLNFGGDASLSRPIAESLRRLHVPTIEISVPDARLMELFGRALFVIRPDLHIAWRGDTPPDDPSRLARRMIGHHPDPS